MKINFPKFQIVGLISESVLSENSHNIEGRPMHWKTPLHLDICIKLKFTDKYQTAHFEEV